MPLAILYRDAPRGRLNLRRTAHESLGRCRVLNGMSAAGLAAAQGGLFSGWLTYPIHFTGALPK